MIRLHKLSKRTRKRICRYWHHWIVTRQMRVLGTWNLGPLRVDSVPGDDCFVTVMQGVQ